MQSDNVPSFHNVSTQKKLLSFFLYSHYCCLLDRICKYIYKREGFYGTRLVSSAEPPPHFRSQFVWNSVKWALRWATETALLSLANSATMSLVSKASPWTPTLRTPPSPEDVAENSWTACAISAAWSEAGPRLRRWRLDFCGHSLCPSLPLSWHLQVLVSWDGGAAGQEHFGYVESRVDFSSVVDNRSQSKSLTASVHPSCPAMSLTWHFNVCWSCDSQHTVESVEGKCISYPVAC